MVAIDIGKGALAAWLGPRIAGGFDPAGTALACTLAAAAGHTWPVFFGFRGGKGAATLVGGLLVAWPIAVPLLLVAWLLVAQPILVGASLRTHFDALAVALMLAGLALVVAERPVLGLTVLGLATMTKLFPAVLVPGVVLYLLARYRDREALLGTLAFAAVVVVLALPFAGQGLVDMARFHLDRPIQIESTPASVLWAT